MDSLHCFLVFSTNKGYDFEVEVTLSNFQNLIKDLKCNYIIQSFCHEDMLYFYLINGPESIYIGCCSAWLDIK